MWVRSDGSDKPKIWLKPYVKNSYLAAQWGKEEHEVPMRNPFKYGTKFYLVTAAAKKELMVTLLCGFSSYKK